MGKQTAETAGAWHEFGFKDRVTVQLQIAQYKQNRTHWVPVDCLTFTGTVVAGAVADPSMVAILPDVALPIGHEYANASPVGLNQVPFWAKDPETGSPCRARYQILPQILAQGEQPAA
ncbi:MAG TPA: hypothetical protein VHB51_02640 [Candidatus Saccharimonadales bacterium]|nr:hypothetical protein [Candidatus Saccharimonadales bacterium]